MAVNSKARAALFAPYPHWPLIVAGGIGPTLMAATVSRELLAPAVIVAIMLQIVVFGRILSQVLPGRVSSFWGILREYGLSYVIAGFIAGAVGVILLQVVVRIMPPRFPNVISGGAVHAAVAMVTIYVWPIVFLRRTSVAAILAGVSYLMDNIASSLWIAGIIVLGEVIQTVGQLVYLEYRTGWGFVIMLIAGVTFVYLMAVTYAAALHALLSVRFLDSNGEA
jgi:hypothetical protein